MVQKMKKSRKFSNNIFAAPATTVPKPQLGLRATHNVTVSHNHNNIEFLCINCNNRIKISTKNYGTPILCSNCNKHVIAPQQVLARNVIIDNDFIIKKLLNQGTSGVIYKAYQSSLNRECVLKILSNDTKDSSSLLEEARLTAKLTHHNIIQCYAVNKYDNFYYCAMEYVEGLSLKELLNREQKLDYYRALNIIIQLATALNYAWKRCQLVHHDISPSNIMLKCDDTVKLCDLGLARLNNAVTTEIDNDFFCGTPEYSSPENIMGEKVNAQGDIYSLGIIFYLLVTGHLPYSDKDRVATMKKHLTETPPSPKIYTTKLPNSFVNVIKKMMAKKLKQRYQNYDILLEELMQLQFECNKVATTKFDSLTSKLTRAHFTSSSIKNTPTIITEQYQNPIKLKSKITRQIIFSKIAIAFIGIITLFLILFYCLVQTDDQQLQSAHLKNTNKVASTK
jgi:serine/threonine protein kinase